MERNTHPLYVRNQMALRNGRGVKGKIHKPVLVQRVSVERKTNKGENKIHTSTNCLAVVC